MIEEPAWLRTLPRTITCPYSKGAGRFGSTCGRSLWVEGHGESAPP